MDNSLVTCLESETLSLNWKVEVLPVYWKSNKIAYVLAVIRFSQLIEVYKFAQVSTELLLEGISHFIVINLRKNMFLNSCKMQNHAVGIKNKS